MRVTPRRCQNATNATLHLHRPSYQPYLPNHHSTITPTTLSHPALPLLQQVLLLLWGGYSERKVAYSCPWRC